MIRKNATFTTPLSRLNSTLTTQLYSHDSTPLSRLNSTLTTQLYSHDSTQLSHRRARVRDSLLRLKSLLGGSTYKKERKKETRWECIVRHDERGHNALCPLSSRDTSCLSLSPTQQVSLSPISRHIMSLSPTHHVSLSHSTSLAISYFTANATHQNPPNWETQSTQYLAVQIQIAILLLFLYRGIRDFRFGEFRGCSIFSGIGDRPHDVSLAIRVYTVERALCTVKRALYTVKRTLCNIITRYDMTCVCVCVCDRHDVASCPLTPIHMMSHYAHDVSLGHILCCYSQGVYCAKSPMYSGKSPTYSGKSPIHCENSLYTVERAIKIMERALYNLERALYTVDRALSIVERAPNTVERAPYTTERGLYTLERALNTVERDESLKKGP